MLHQQNVKTPGGPDNDEYVPHYYREGREVSLAELQATLGKAPQEDGQGQGGGFSEEFDNVAYGVQTVATDPSNHFFRNQIMLSLAIFGGLFGLSYLPIPGIQPILMIASVVYLVAVVYDLGLIYANDSDGLNLGLDDDTGKLIGYTWRVNQMILNNIIGAKNWVFAALGQCFNAMDAQAKDIQSAEQRFGVQGRGSSHSQMRALSVDRSGGYSSSELPAGSQEDGDDFSHEKLSLQRLSMHARPGQQQLGVPAHRTGTGTDHQYDGYAQSQQALQSPR